MDNIKLTIHTDGGARGNPGPAAIGVVISHPSVPLPRLGLAEEAHTFKEYIGKATNNEAEYKAVILALKEAQRLLGKRQAKEAELEINVDSELVCKQMKGEYKIKEERLQKFFVEIWNMKQDFGEVSFNYVRREQNKEADKLVNEVLDGRR